MKFYANCQVFFFLAIAGCSSSSSGKWGDRWSVDKNSFSSVAFNLIRRIASSTQTSTKQEINLRGDSIQSKYFLSDELTSVTPSLSPTDKGIYDVRDLSANRLVHVSRRPDLTGLFNDPYGSEDGTTLLVNMDHSRHSSLIKTAVPYSLYSPVVYEKDSYSRAVESSRAQCRKLKDPSDCFDFSQLFQQSISSFRLECEINRSPNGQHTKCDPFIPVDFTEFHSLQLKENFLLPKPIMLLSPNEIEVRYVRLNQHKTN